MNTYDLESRLKMWSWWKNNIINGNAGWPQETILSRLVSTGGCIIRSTLSTVTTIPNAVSNETAEEIDLLLKKMDREYPEYSKALSDYYLGNQPVHILAKAHNCSRSSYMQRVKSGKVWLSGFIASKKQS